MERGRGKNRQLAGSNWAVACWSSRPGVLCAPPYTFSDPIPTPTCPQLQPPPFARSSCPFPPSPSPLTQNCFEGGFCWSCVECRRRRTTGGRRWRGGGADDALKGVTHSAARDKGGQRREQDQSAFCVSPQCVARRSCQIRQHSAILSSDPVLLDFQKVQQTQVELVSLAPVLEPPPPKPLSLSPTPCQLTAQLHHLPPSRTMEQKRLGTIGLKTLNLRLPSLTTPNHSLRPSKPLSTTSRLTA